MISYIKGSLIYKKEKFLIIENNGVGYKVFVSEVIFENILIGERIELVIYEKTTEQGRFFYGLKNFEELDFFESLLGVSGIGPKTALAILSSGDVNNIKRSIFNNDDSLISSASGVGKKTAQRVVMELKDKIDFIDQSNEDGNISNVGSDEVEALVGLGYTINDARNALFEASKDFHDSSSRLRAALKYLGSKR